MNSIGAIFSDAPSVPPRLKVKYRLEEVRHITEFSLKEAAHNEYFVGADNQQEV